MFGAGPRTNVPVSHITGLAERNSHKTKCFTYDDETQFSACRVASLGVGPGASALLASPTLEAAPLLTVCFTQRQIKKANKNE